MKSPADGSTEPRARRLRTAISTPEGKSRYVRRLFSTIADRYDFITRALSFGQDRRWKQRLIRLAALAPGERVLDLACGTGDLLNAAQRAGCRTVGIDITHRMLQLANRRPQRGFAAATSRTNHQLVQADMLWLPLPPAAVDVVTTGYGLRNVTDLPRALEEIRRVLTPGGRFLSLDFNRPQQAFVRAAYLTYLAIVGSLFGLVLHGDPDTYRYIPESIRRYPGATGVARLLERHGFSDVRVVPVMGGLMTIHVARVAPARSSAFEPGR